MTPYTLECGGKSPTYIDESAELETAAKRMLWGKLLNAGQTCVAPDYVLCTKETQVSYFTIIKS
jgi:acyl-CoA reductase-like NAD-dependent aldehyde dehydrogenase